MNHYYCSSRPFAITAAGSAIVAIDNADDDAVVVVVDGDGGCESWDYCSRHRYEK